MKSLKVTEDIPGTIMKHVAAILPNLRDPLDNMLAILSDKRRGKDSGVAFPFFTKIEDYCTEIKKIKKLLPDGTIKLIRSAQTYPGGNAHLRALHFLNRNKKHKIPVRPFNLRTSCTAQAMAVFKGGRLLRIGFKNGQRLVPILPLLPGASNLAAISNPSFIPDEGYVFEPAPGDDEMELCAVVPGTQFQAHFKPTLDIAFTETPGLEREPIGIALHKMRELVNGILLTFENRFFS